jgi:hypothetical protein
METSSSGPGFKPDAAFASAAERFFELLKACGAPAHGGAQDWSSIATPLASQFEQWLRVWQSAGPWLGGAATPAAGFAAAAPAWPFRPLPLGPAAALPADGERTLELVGRLTQLQAQLATHWSEIANTAARRFVQRLGGAPSGPPSLEQAMKLYELWVSCAEEAYAATVHREEFARLQAEIANTSAALLVEQRRQLEALTRASGLPTRNEVDALYGQLKELRRELAGLTRREDPSPTPRRAPQPPRARGERPRSVKRKPRSRTPSARRPRH